MHARRAPPLGRQHGAVGQCGAAVDEVAALRPQGAAGRGRPSRCGGQGSQRARPVAGALQGHVSAKVLTPLGAAVQGGRGGASGSRGSPSGGRGGRGGGSRRFSEAPKDGIIANDQIPCVPAAACAALALPAPQSSPSTRPGRTCEASCKAAAGVAGARRYACWAWRRRCWA